MSNILQFLIPRDRKFFPLFEKASGNLWAVSKVLTALVNAPPDKRKEFTKEIDRLEHIGDSITHEIFNELSATFITPFDREDIHALASVVDDVVDYIHGSAKRMDLYKLETLTPAVIKLAELIEKSSEELHNAVSGLKDMKNMNRIKEACVRINSIENHADDIFDMAVAKLFEDETSAIEIIKMKEVLSALETATDKCEDAANVIESIIVKNS